VKGCVYRAAVFDVNLSREHQEQDDAQLEKQARDIIEGKKRVKRRGFDLGSDESGSDDEDADRRRRKSIKKPRFDDGKLEGISSFIILPRLSMRFPLIPSLTGGDVDPSAFLSAYHSNLEDTEPLFPVDEDSQMAERGDEEDEDDGNSDGDPKKTVSRAEIEAQVRKAAREKVAFPISEWHDDEWLLIRSTSRNTMRSIRLILRIPVSWIGIRMTTSLPCAPAKLRRGLLE
jgi:hypothetical protein